MAVFEEIKSRLTTASIMVTLDWNKEFEIMCDSSDYAMRVVLEQRTGHARFYRRFIRDFSKTSRQLCILLEKDAKFDFDESCKAAFEEIKSRLTTAPIMVTLDWNREFEIMCDDSDYAMRAVLGQRTRNIFKVIYYGSKTFNEA